MNGCGDRKSGNKSHGDAPLFSCCGRLSVSLLFGGSNFTNPRCRRLFHSLSHHSSIFPFNSSSLSCFSTPSTQKHTLFMQHASKYNSTPWLHRHQQPSFSLLDGGQIPGTKPSSVAWTFWRRAGSSRYRRAKSQKTRKARSASFRLHNTFYPHLGAIIILQNVTLSGN